MGPSSRCLISGLHRGHARLALTSQVRHYSEHPLHDHELRSMMHFMLLHPQDHLETGLVGRRHSRWHSHTFTQKIVREAFQPPIQPVAFAFQERDDFSLAPGRLLVSNKFFEEGREIETLKSVPA